MDFARLSRETLSIVDAGRYDGPAGPVEFATAVRAAIAGTCVITPDEARALAAAPSRTSSATARVEVTEESTAAAARRLLVEGPVAVLNFASARSVGGGFLAGARAQEEALCCSSALFRCLERGRGYYHANRANGGALYTDHAIWSPAVPFFRDDDFGLSPAPYPLSVITSPAPNTSAVQGDEITRVPETFRRRAAQVLGIAAARSQTCLVLGAWGCGAFGGDPAMVADAWAEALDAGFRRSFARVVFAVLVRQWPDPRNLSAFGARFG